MTIKNYHNLIEFLDDFFIVGEIYKSNINIRPARINPPLNEKQYFHLSEDDLFMLLSKENNINHKYDRIYNIKMAVLNPYQLGIITVYYDIDMYRTIEKVKFSYERIT